MAHPPWLDDTLAPNGRRVCSNFRRWFALSAVVDAAGDPAVMFHGTWREFDGNEFKHEHDKLARIDASLGFHFGTRQAANKRIESPLRRLERYPHRACRDGIQPSIMPVYLRIERPLRTRDVGAWQHPDMVMNALLDAGIEIAMPQRQRFVDASLRRTEAFKQLIGIVQAQGYDGIVYSNKTEHRGSDSYIAFCASQVKSALGNCGLWARSHPSLTDHETLQAVLQARRAMASIRGEHRREAAPC